MKLSQKSFDEWSAPVLACLLTVGCGAAPAPDELVEESEGSKNAVASPAEAERALAPARMYIDPVDLSSNIAHRPLRIVVQRGQLDLEQATLDELAARVRLELEPEGTAVPVTVRAELKPRTRLLESGDARPKDAPLPIVAPQVEDDEPRATITVTPVTELSGRWYRLTVDGLPSGVVAYEGTTMMRDGARLYARFNPASAPVLRHVRICDKGEGRIRAVAEYSEPIARSSDQGLELTDASGAQRCRFALASPEAPAAAAARLFDYDCDGMATSSSWRMALRSMSSASGVRLRPIDQAEFYGEIQDLPKDRQGCALWRP